MRQVSHLYGHACGCQLKFVEPIVREEGRMEKMKEGKETVELTDLACASAQDLWRVGCVGLQEVVRRTLWFECFGFGLDALNDGGCCWKREQHPCYRSHEG
jgi:hypothetical protein